MHPCSLWNSSCLLHCCGIQKIVFVQLSLVFSMSHHLHALLITCSVCCATLTTCLPFATFVLGFSAQAITKKGRLLSLSIILTAQQLCFLNLSSAAQRAFGVCMLGRANRTKKGNCLCRCTTTKVPQSLQPRNL